MRRVNRNSSEPVRFTLNGKPVAAHAESRMLLTDFLRQELGATGTHVGCEHGVCGCCTILVDGVATRGCLMLAVQADGRSVDTVESLSADGITLNALQVAFREHHALQCGYCTPGILISFTDYLRRTDGNVSAEGVREVLSGHICRCTGYNGIVRAVLDAANKRRRRA